MQLNAPSETPAAAVHDLQQRWQRGLAGDRAIQREWTDLDGGAWRWTEDGLRLGSGAREWYSLQWDYAGSSLLRRLANFVVEVTVQGTAQAAGISFGPFRDFLTESGSSPRRLQLEVDAIANQWRFRVDGHATERAWWNSAVTSAEDILGGTLSMKARRPQDVSFQDFSFGCFDESCQLSIVITCNRFLQRLRVALANWCRQDAPSGSYEVLIVNPSSPDGAGEHIRAVAASYPEVRVSGLAVPAKTGANKGAMINHAISLARGQWVLLTDADCLFATGAASLALREAARRPSRLLFGQRRHLSMIQVAGLLSGRIDGAAEFEALASSPSHRPFDNAPWGYIQLLPRSVFNLVRYGESFNHFAHSDSHFAEACRARGITPEAVPGLMCLHLDHPFAWYGTSEFL